LLRFGSFCRVIYSHCQARSGIPIVTSTLRTFTRASSSSSSASSPRQDSSDDYPEIGASAHGNSAKDTHLILMVAPNEDWSHNGSSGYLTIGRSEMSDAQNPSAGLVRNLNPDFNVIRVQAIMETSSIWHLIVLLLHSWLSKGLRWRTSF
jgi:hypothetical protein